MFKTKEMYQAPEFQTEKYIHLENENCYVVACIHENDSTKHSFAVQDIFSTINKPRLVELVSIETRTSCRGKGLGTAYIDKILREFKDDIIISIAAALETEYPLSEYSYEGEGTGDKELPIDDILERLSHFFARSNFKDVNKLFGSYECRDTYLYIGNTKGKDLYKTYLDKIHEHEKFQGMN